MKIATKFNSLTLKADETQIYKYIVHNVAKEYGKNRLFMPKPITGDNGSGMHCNMSLFDAEGNNAFFDPNDPKGMQLSETAYHFLGSLIKHAYNYTAIMNPTC